MLFRSPTPETDPVADGARAEIVRRQLLLASARRLLDGGDPATVAWRLAGLATNDLPVRQELLEIPDTAGRLDRLDWAFYWADHVSQLILPPLFLHFAVVFPSRPTWFRGSRWRKAFPLTYVPAFALIGGLIALMAAGPSATPRFGALIELAGRVAYLHLALYVIAGVAVFVKMRWHQITGVFRKADAPAKADTPASGASRWDAK